MMANRGGSSPAVITNKPLLGVRTDDSAIYNRHEKALNSDEMRDGGLGVARAEYKKGLKGHWSVL